MKPDLLFYGASNIRILLVEDDSIVGELISLALKNAEYVVDWAKDGASAADLIDKKQHNVLLLDLGLPKRDGLELLVSMRQNGNTVPVIVITGRQSLGDRIRALNLGADDFLSKPFRLKEMLARLRAVLRRSEGEKWKVLSNGLISLDLETHEVRRGEASYVLTAKEFALLRALLIRPGTILSRFDLEQRLYSEDEPVESNSVDFLIHGIRQKLGADVIKNVRGTGWMVARPT
jgi:two-component system OmpR family response regulator